MEITFPPAFFWGIASAAHQVEGGNVYNDNWVLEHVPDNPYVESSGDACDHYHLYRGDIGLFAELGFTLYRFSLEWSRIEPEEGEFSLAQLDHYRRMLATCHEHGITPMVTFHHFTSPRWLAASGGWEAQDTLIKSIGVMVSARTEPWFEAAAHAVNSNASHFTPFMYADAERGRATILAAHRRAVEVIKAGPGRCEVGLTMAMQDIQAGPGGEEMAARMRRELQDVYLEATRGDDFIGVQTYSRQRFGSDGPLGPEAGVERTQGGDEFWPEALEATIRHASAVTGRPVFVTENGVATIDDTRRIAYVERALRGVASCLRDGIDVRGYTYWSALDSFEWISGYRLNMGLIAVDRQTQARTVKPSAGWLGRVAQAHGF